MELEKSNSKSNNQVQLVVVLFGFFRKIGQQKLIIPGDPTFSTIKMVKRWPMFP